MRTITLKTTVNRFTVHYAVYDNRMSPPCPVAAFKYRTHAVLFMRSLNTVNGSTPFNFEVVACHPGMEVSNDKSTID